MKPLYTIKMYRPDCYKVVKFKRSAYDLPFLPLREEEFNENDGKLDNSLSRTRSRIIELALCNHWDYFFTGTIDETKFDRYDLDKFRKALSQWFRDQRKKYDADLRFLMVPEFHEDGAVHVHGFFAGLPADRLIAFDVLGETQAVPVKLLHKGLSFWQDYAEKFGHCSLSPVKNPIGCAFYITKYITKDLCDRRDLLGRHLFFASQGLNSAQIVGDVFTYSPLLDRFLTDEFDFCSTGFITQKLAGDNITVDWAFPAQLGDLLQEHIERLPDPYAGWDEDDEEIQSCVQELAEYEQIVLNWSGYTAGWCNGSTQGYESW